MLSTLRKPGAAAVGGGEYAEVPLEGGEYKRW